MKTERITLRHWLDTDAKALYKYASDPEVGPRQVGLRIFQKRRAWR